MSVATDGYYYRDAQGVTQGPLTEEKFQSHQTKGLLKPGLKVWRQKNGSIFQGMCAF